MVKLDRPQNDNIVRRMHFACWITNAVDTYWEYVILTAFPQQQWLYESSSLLRFFLCCLSCYNNTDIIRMHIWRVVCVNFKHSVAVFLHLLCYVRWNGLPIVVVRVRSGLLALIAHCTKIYRHLKLYAKKRCFVKYKIVAIVVWFVYIRKVKQEEKTGLLKRCGVWGEKKDNKHI